MNTHHSIRQDIPASKRAAMVWPEAVTDWKAAYERERIRRESVEGELAGEQWLPLISLILGVVLGAML